MGAWQPIASLGPGAAVGFIGLAPVIIGVLVLIHIVRTLDALRTDVRRIADRLERDELTSRR